MAKKARKKFAVKRSKKSKKKSRPAAKKKKNIAKRAYRAVVDTFKGTDRLRNKMEQPGTSESE